MELSRTAARRAIGVRELLPCTVDLPFKRWPTLLSFWFYGVNLLVAPRPVAAVGMRAALQETTQVE